MLPVLRGRRWAALGGPGSGGGAGAYPDLGWTGPGDHGGGLDGATGHLSPLTALRLGVLPPSARASVYTLKHSYPPSLPPNPASVCLSLFLSLPVSGCLSASASVCLSACLSLLPSISVYLSSLSSLSLGPMPEACNARRRIIRGCHPPGWLRRPGLSQ